MPHIFGSMSILSNDVKSKIIYYMRHNMRKHESGRQIMLFGPCAATATNLKISEHNSFC